MRFGEPELYGHETLQDIEKRRRKTAKALGIEIVFQQSNAEGQLVAWIHEARTKAMGITQTGGIEGV